MIEELLVFAGVFLATAAGQALGRWLGYYFDQRRQERKHNPFHAHGCHDCKHTNKSYDEEPCCYCDVCDLWEDAEG